MNQEIKTQRTITTKKQQKLLWQSIFFQEIFEINKNSQTIQ